MKRGITSFLDSTLRNQWFGCGEFGLSKALFVSARWGTKARSINRQQEMF